MWVQLFYSAHTLTAHSLAVVAFFEVIILNALIVLFIGKGHFSKHPIEAYSSTESIEFIDRIELSSIHIELGLHLLIGCKWVV